MTPFRRSVLVCLLAMGVPVATLNALPALAASSRSDSDSARARAAWAEAVRLAKERNRGNVCEADAYQSTILKHLKTATSLSPYLRREATRNAPLRKALAGNLSYFEVTDRMKTPTQIAEAVAQAYFESMEGGALGPSMRFQLETGNRLALKTVHIDDDSNVVTETTRGSYDLEQGEAILLKFRVGSEVLDYQLERSDDGYFLNPAHGDGMRLANEPDDCSV